MEMMLHLVFVETPLELVPPELLSHPSVRRNAKRRGKRPEETLLDRSLHHFAMDRLPSSEKRGRPDIIHFCLLEAMGSPLNRASLLRVYVNTIGGKIIDVSPCTRLPRDYNRFKSLIEQLLLYGRAPTGGEEPLLLLRDMRISDLVEEVKPTRVVALTSHGRLSSFQVAGETLSEVETPMALIGAHPSGPMDKETLAVADLQMSVYPDALEAWTVTSRILYEVEKQSGIYKPVCEL
jgi:rRNA small subunit pseudouridine methyltransferase Nep1